MKIFTLILIVMVAVVIMFSCSGQVSEQILPASTAEVGTIEAESHPVAPGATYAPTSISPLETPLPLCDPRIC